MMLRRGTSLPVAGVAAAGVVAGHALAYVVAVRQPVHRSDILHATGHSYWTAAVALAIVLGFGALAAVGFRALRGRGERREIPRFATIASRLAVVQIIAYAMIESTERFLSRVRIAELLDHHDLLAIGTAIQFLVALAGALVVHLLARTLALVAETLRSAPPRRTTAQASLRPASPPSLRSRALRGAWGLRGPPPVLASVAG